MVRPLFRMKELRPICMLKPISIIKLMFKKWQRLGVEGVNEVEPVIGQGVTLSQPVTGTLLIHLNGHWRPNQTETISILGCLTVNNKPYKKMKNLMK